jgi:GMP synthase-like glutamine amidotransferase
MDTNVSLDLGKNFTELIEKLAQSIGTTADKVFPWYVKQEYIGGIAALTISVLALVLLGMAAVISYKRAYAFHQDEYEYRNFWEIPAIICTMAFIVALFFVCLGMPIMVTSVLNPEYGAVHAMISDIAKMTGK